MPLENDRSRTPGQKARWRGGKRSIVVAWKARAAEPQVAKSDHLYRRTANRILDAIEALEPGDPAPSEAVLTTLCGVSRSPVRAALQHLIQNGVLAVHGNERIVARKPLESDRFDETQVHSPADHVESVFMELVLRQDLLPGQRFTEAELARRADTSTAVVREYLIRLSRFGVIRKRPRGSWTLMAFDAAFANELADMRYILEMTAIDAFASLGADHPVWAEVERMIGRHKELASQIDERFHDFSALDQDFHAMIIGAKRNRFFSDMFDVMTLIFHYHYQWGKVGEKERNKVAVNEHLGILDALAARDIATAKDRLAAHLAVARRTLLHAISPSSRPNGPGNLPIAALPRMAEVGTAAEN
ncbi:DNA-binding transcriptional regulator, GntR family [Pseudoxanthobacter soli DSM 19599]|uniref:DNA-binding transcriptional regulator, GntR family n=1 Tax=Pseudoxanthobacter soli DSM 19599 TaxID=1123029 RepID=A0A1M7ZN32_9HYPH|nr:DNA-binding transcriptional regulator, GntR family [Pseudoxanthobacter soli DSM 19599]